MILGKISFGMPGEVGGTQNLRKFSPDHIAAHDTVPTEVELSCLAASRDSRET